jgi:DNA-binding MarR family transcriptional regulator
MKGFYIEISNGLLAPEHRKRMGTAVWEFMWLLDKVTKVDEEGIGWVLGGKSIKRDEIKEDIGIDVGHISENLNKLQNEGYISLTRTPYGLVIKVANAKKRYSQKVILPKGNIRNRLKATSENKKATSNKDKTVRQDSKTITPLISSPLLENHVKKKYSSLDDLTEDALVEISNKYKVPLSFVRLQLEKMTNWLEAKGKRYKNYKRALMNWVLSDAQKQIERRQGDPSKRGADYRHLG